MTNRMTNRTGCAAALLLLAFAAEGHAQPAKPAQWPKIVMERTRDLDRECRDLGEAPARRQNYVHSVDLNSDGVADYLVDEGEYMCGTTPAMFAGNGGAAFQVFVSDGKNGHRFSYDGFGPGVRIGQRGPRAVVYVTATGAGCGAPARTRASEVSCERALIPVGTSAKLTLGPPSPLPK